jgi:hypothetical protein
VRDLIEQAHGYRVDETYAALPADVVVLPAR